MLPVQVRAVKVPAGWQVTSPLPEYPSLQTTACTAPVTPVISPVASRSEFATSVSVQATA